MAKLLPPYALCPLIEYRKCLGVCEDSTPGCVIVTLGKNIVIRYRLSDQKQVNSWSSKDKLSAPVIFDFSSKRYVAIFKSDQVAFWIDSLEQLNNLKKFKFTCLIFNILSSKDCPPVVVYQNGSIGMLHDELQSRKNAGNHQFLEDLEEIISSDLKLVAGDLYVTLLTFKSDIKVKRLHFVPVDADKADRFSITLEDRENHSFNSFTFIEGDSSSLISLWSDGSVFSVELPVKDVKSFPGRLVSKVESVNLSLPAILHSIGEQQVVIYGAAPNSEGAVLCIFNLKYGLVDSLQKLKVYCETPRLWVVGSNRYILCLSGSHLVVVPTRFVTQKLSSLIGISKINQDDSNNSLPDSSSVITASWNSNNDVVSADDVMELENHNGLSEKISEMRKKGFPDYLICDELLPPLIEKVDEEQIMNFLLLVKDIPDNWLIDLAIKFNKTIYSTTLLKTILKRPLVSDNSSLQIIRSGMELPDVLRLLTTISKLIDEHQIDNSFLDWASILLDSHYQQYLLSRDETVTDTMKAVNNIVQLQMEYMTCLKTLHNELVSLEKGHIQFNKSSVSSQSYTVDIVNFG